MSNVFLSDASGKSWEINADPPANPVDIGLALYKPGGGSDSKYIIGMIMPEGASFLTKEERAFMRSGRTGRCGRIVILAQDGSVGGGGGAYAPDEFERELSVFRCARCHTLKLRACVRAYEGGEHVVYCSPECQEDHKKQCQKK
jgi:hypothetical protein